MITLALENLDHFNIVLSHLRTKADRWFKRLEIPEEKRRISVSADLRYLRQNFELNISLPGDHIAVEDITTIQTQFHGAHAAEYGHSTLGETIQAVNLRLRAGKSLSKPILKPMDDNTSGTITAATAESRFVWFPGGQMQCQVYQRKNLKIGQTIKGPAIIQEKEATTLVDNKWRLLVDQFSNLVIERL
jgi:N-methylhydantoinase A